MCDRVTKMACQCCGSTEWKSGHVSGGSGGSGVIFRCAACDRDVERLKREAQRKRFDHAPGVLVPPTQLSFSTRELAQPQGASHG